MSGGKSGTLAFAGYRSEIGIKSLLYKLEVLRHLFLPHHRLSVAGKQDLYIQAGDALDASL